MTLSRLHLTQFRSWARLDLELDGRPLAIHGPNGAGKTNILEAASMLSPGRGMRGAPPGDQARQGPDVGPQYRSAIYYHNDEQEKVAREITKQANEQWYKGGIKTEIAPAGQWWDAEDYHQQYLHKHPNGYCNHGFCQVAYDAQAHGQDGVDRVELPEA